MNKKPRAEENKIGQKNSACLNAGNNRRRLFRYGAGLIFLTLSLALWVDFHSPPKASAEDLSTEIEKALYTRQEFFGAPAIVSIPTKQARENLRRLADAQPENQTILEKLAELDEKLVINDEAENILINATQTNSAKLANLAAFYERRANFEKEGEVLRRMLLTAPAEQRAGILSRLIVFARRHDLKNYLQPEFYAQIARENPETYEIFEKLVDNFIEEANYAEALKLVRQAKTLFPARHGALLEKEIALLLDLNQPEEAEAVYQAAFDPFWTEEEAEKFYNFLNRHDRLRAYGSEIRARFKKNLADFDAAIRLALYQNHDYSVGDDELTPIILKLEAAKKDWTTAELVTVTRLLLRGGEAQTASRFLYTLYLQEDFKRDGAMRAQILYQLFEMFSDAETEKLPLTRGDLRFYEDVAKTDTSPGIATGILSLIFSDTNPGEKLAAQETEANKHFNRAAAYRIFLAYKNEFPTTPELAQMYLDIVSLYTATKEPEIAAQTLDEFAGRYENSSDYPAVALKLAEAFTAAGEPEKSREVYRKILDSLGRQGNIGAPKTESNVEPSGNLVVAVQQIPDSPENGINIPAPEKKTEYDYAPENRFHDFLTRKTAAVSYAEVLGKLVTALAKEKKTSEILALYSDEIQKYPEQEWLYEQRLTWLEQTNLTDEQLKVYQAALARFQSPGWRDKLARWFLRHNRQTDFAEFSTDLIGKLDDREAQDYLSQFASQNLDAKGFESQLSFRLYQSAHERFPHNQAFVEGLLRFYKTNRQYEEWRSLAAEYYFELKGVREQFLDDLAEKNELRRFQAQAAGNSGIYELFRADAAIRLSDYENAVSAYRKLNELYPNTPEFTERAIALTRSFGQKDRQTLNESAELARAQADYAPSSAADHTRSGELYAELGDYEKARAEWQKLISSAAGDRETYLAAATINWDYFQYDEALAEINTIRRQFADETLYAFETGAILESQHRRAEAVAEYVKALAGNGDTGGKDERQQEKAKNRLIALVNAERRAAPGKKTAETATEKLIETAFQRERGKQGADDSLLTLGYAEFLSKIKQTEKASQVLKQAVLKSKDQKFIESARDFYQEAENAAGEQLTLKRLAETCRSPRQAIAYRLQLAQSYAESGKTISAKSILSALVREFPTNYGVLTEAADFYNRLGDGNEAVSVLQNALPRSVSGRYRTALALKLAGDLTRQNRLAAAAQILSALYEEDKSETSIFDALAKIYVRTGEPEKLRQIFSEVVDELEKSDTDRRELNAQLSELREQMIDAFTRLKDYKSAVEQHIEIINREPGDEEATENAIKYVERYGGAETLLGYYQKTAAQSFKNYRWNVVLARIYEAQNDPDNAAKNYRSAIDNQPEMPELYLGLAELEAKRNNYSESIKLFDEILRLTNDAPQYLLKKIEIMKKAGRTAEAEKEAAKLPIDEQPKTKADGFAQAWEIKLTDKDKARELYRASFDHLLENPLTGAFKTVDISGYVESMREAEPLDQINSRIWELRGKLIAKADELNSADAGEARKRLSVIEGALIETVGRTAQTVGTDEERAALHEDLSGRLQEVSFKSDNHQTLSLIQDLSRRAGMGDLEERILRKKIAESDVSTGKSSYVQALFNFYDERGAYQQALDVLENSDSNDLSLKAKTAQLAGNREKQLEAWRAIYWKNDKLAVSANDDVAHYLEILYRENRDELKSLTAKSSAYQLQLINFLLGKGERELAHAATESAPLPTAWKVSRHAEISLALHENGETAECYFCAALQFDTIGNLVNQMPDKQQFLVGDDWFRLTREYGEWLDEKPGEIIPPEKFLVSMIENQPRNTAEQFKLGEYYLQKHNLKPAIEHFRLALELDPNNGDAWTNLGVAYYLANKKDWADESWSKVLQADEISLDISFFETLRKFGLQEKARQSIAPLIIRFLQTNDAENSADFQNLIRAAANSSFTSDEEKSQYFRQILIARPKDLSLAAMLLNESLIGNAQQGDFYEILIERSEKFNSYDRDYAYTSAAEKTWTPEDAESVLDQDSDYQPELPNNKRFGWQMKYLKLLLAEREDSRAKKLIADIEKDLSGRYAAPSELRLAKLQLQIRDGQFNLAAAESLIGIRVSEQVTEIKPPSVERFNDVLQILKKENRESEMPDLSESFFARQLALEEFSPVNFAGLARAYLEKNEPDKALHILELMIDLCDEAKRQKAAGEIAALDIVKAKSADAAKISEKQANNSILPFNALGIAAQVAAEFQQPGAAVTFRRRLLEIAPQDTGNRIELAKLLAAGGSDNGKTEAIEMLWQVNASRDTVRGVRWEARNLLREMGDQIEFASFKDDSLAQLSAGLEAERNGQNEIALEFFINSLIAEKDAETPARQELIKLYIAHGNSRAAFTIADTDKSPKSDDLLTMLSEAAEKIAEYARAINYEKAKSLINAERIKSLEHLQEEQNRRATDFSVDLKNTRAL